METKKALKQHMMKGKGAHPDPLAQKLKSGGMAGGVKTRGNGAAVRGTKARGPMA